MKIQKFIKGNSLFPRLEVEKEVEELNELFSEKEDEVVEETIEHKENITIEHKENITIDELDKVELRVGKVLSCEKTSKSR